jgi:type II secretory pathway component PulF
MPKYSFLAKSLDGKSEKGVLEAKDEFELAKVLKERGMILIRAEKIKEKKKVSVFSSLSWSPSFRKNVLYKKFKSNDLCWSSIAESDFEFISANKKQKI